MIPFLLSAWRAGLRSRSVQAILVLGIVLMGVAYLSSAFSPRQPKTVALDVGLDLHAAVGDADAVAGADVELDEPLGGQQDALTVRGATRQIGIDGTHDRSPR